MDIFEQGTRQKLRFVSDRGLLTIEDLWSFNLPKVKQMGNALAKELKETEFDIFETKTSSDNEAALKLEIIKRIVEVRISEQEAAKELASKQLQKEKILAIMAKKKDESLEQASLEDLEAMLNNL